MDNSCSNNTNTGGSSSSQMKSGSNSNSNTLQRQKVLKQLSHKLSLGLRHKAIEYQWNISNDGYVPIQEILHHSMFGKYTIEDIIEVVQTNDKQRYSIAEFPSSKYYGCNTTNNNVNNTIPTTNTTGNTTSSITGNDMTLSNNTNTTTILCIRANQGHSMTCIHPDLLLYKLSSNELVNDYPIMVHGTYYKAWEFIQVQGLHTMTRNHIHFAIGLPTLSNNNQNTVISGMRKNCEVYIYINIEKCVTDNIIIYKSSNNVLLTAGWNDSGILPIEYFSYVTDSNGNILMDRR